MMAFDGLRGIASRVKRWSPGAAMQRLHDNRERALFEQQLSALRGVVPAASPLAAGHVLVDGTFDNPNYWWRYALLRAGAGLDRGREAGLIGRWRRREARTTFGRLGIDEIIDGRTAHQPFLGEARRLIERTRRPADILSWELPSQVPGDIVYDGLLKRQRAAVVDLTHPRLTDHVAEALADIAFAGNLVASRPWSLFALSHVINFNYGALAWCAARQGIPVIVCFGNYGTPRYWRLDEPRQIYDGFDRPTAADLDHLSASQAEAFEDIGRRYLAKRHAGRTDDVGSIYAFQRNASHMDRGAIAAEFGWPAERPIVTVYASNWFDFPHAAGMTQFRDFLDWTNVTLEAARANTAVSWLFRAHPCDQWYGGQTLSDLMPADSGPHIKLCPTHWHGADVLHASDAVITVHGTIGIEAPMIGKPALLADAGWYHDCGFAQWSRTAVEYRDRLATRWWEGVDTARASRRAAAFAGIYFGMPAWQAPFISGDDSEQARLYPRLTRMLEERSPALDRELATIGGWLASGRRYYHAYKMRQAEAYGGVD